MFSKLNEEKRVLCFESNFINWIDIEDRICDYYGIPEQVSCAIQQVSFNIYYVNMYSAKGEFECEIGILNQPDDVYLVTVYPSNLLKKLHKEKERKGIQNVQEYKVKKLTLGISDTSI